MYLQGTRRRLRNQGMASQVILAHRYPMLTSTICGMMKKTVIEMGVICIVDLDNDYYLVKFSTDEDYNFALFEGPWLIFYHYLSVRRWFTEFNPSTDVIKSIVAWVRFQNSHSIVLIRNFYGALGIELENLLKLILLPLCNQE